MRHYLRRTLRINMVSAALSPNFGRIQPHPPLLPSCNVYMLSRSLCCLQLWGVPRMQSRKKESILNLEKHLDKKVHVKFQGGREGA